METVKSMVLVPSPGPTAPASVVLGKLLILTGPVCKQGYW